MADDSTMWWEDPSTDWGAGEAAKVVDVLSYAYDTRDKIRPLVVSFDVEWADAPPPATPVRDIWIWALRRLAPTNSVLDLLAAVLHDETSSQFHTPLRGLLGDRLGEVNARIALRFGLPAPSAGRDAMVQSIAGTDPRTVAAPPGELQTITEPSGGLMDTDTEIQARLDLRTRTAMIEVAGQPSGTGFLVGNDLVLTAAHVLDRYTWPPPPQRQIVKAVFDYRYSGRSPAETGTRVAVAEFVTGSLPTQAEADGAVGANWDAPAEQLDFALLKLANPVPDPPDTDRFAAPRGHYQLQSVQDEYNYGACTSYIVMQHPLGNFLAVSTLTAEPFLSPGGTRMRYGGNMLAGSSGSAIVDFRGRLVGLHHYGGSVNNQGVPIAVIARALLNGEHAGLFQSSGPVAVSDAAVRIDPFETSSFQQRRPFVNRQNFRAMMRKMTESNGTRILAINGESGTGVSYSYLLTSHVADQSRLCPTLTATSPGGLRALKIDLRSYYQSFKIDRVRTAIVGKLLTEFGIVATPTDPLAQEARDSRTLIDTISPRLRESDKQWWLFFDGIDSLPTVKQGEVDELIHALIDLADDLQMPLRIVLAGRAAEEFADEHTDGSSEKDKVSGLNRGDVDAWLRRRAEEEKREIEEASLEAKLSDLFPPGPMPEPRMLARTLPAALLEVLSP
jgi:hypothetical protein